MTKFHVPLRRHHLRPRGLIPSVPRGRVEFGPMTTGDVWMRRSAVGEVRSERPAPHHLRVRTRQRHLRGQKSTEKEGLPWGLGEMWRGGDCDRTLCEGEPRKNTIKWQSRSSEDCVRV